MKKLWKKIHWTIKIGVVLFGGTSVYLLSSKQPDEKPKVSIEVQKDSTTSKTDSLK